MKYNEHKFIYTQLCPFLLFTLMFGSSHFSFLVTFDDEVRKIQKYYVIFVYILQGKMGKTETNGEKYQKPKDKNLGWTEHKLALFHGQENYCQFKKDITRKLEWYFSNIFHPIVIIRPLKLRNWTSTTPRNKGNFSILFFTFLLHPILFQLAQACWFEKSSLGQNVFFLAHIERIKCPT